MVVANEKYTLCEVAAIVVLGEKWELRECKFLREREWVNVQSDVVLPIEIIFYLV